MRIVLIRYLQKILQKIAESDSTKLEEVKISGFLKMLKSRQGLVFSSLDTSKVNAYLNRSDVKRLIPANLKFLWEHKATITDGKEFLTALSNQNRKRRKSTFDWGNHCRCSPRCGRIRKTSSFNEYATTSR